MVKINTLIYGPKFRPFIEEYVDPVDIDQKAKNRAPVTAIWLFLICVAGFVLEVFVATHISSASLPAISWAISGLTVAIQRPRAGSGSLAIEYLMLLILQVSLLIIDQPTDDFNLIIAISGISALLSLAALIIVLNMPLRDPSLPRSDISKPFSLPTNKLRSPEDNLTLWQWMTVSWMSPLISIGAKRQLHDEDVWLLSYEFQHRHLHDAFRQLQGRVIWRLLKANWIDLVIITVLSLIQLAANVSAPLILQYLLKGMNILHTNKGPAIAFALLTLLVRLVAAQCGVFGLWFGRRCYERSRGEMITMLYEKTLNRKIIGGAPQEKEDESENNKVPQSSEASEQEQNSVDHSEIDTLLGGGNKHQDPPPTLYTTAFRKVKAWIPSWKRKTAVPEPKLPASMGKILNMMRNDVYEVAQRFWEFENLIKEPVGGLATLAILWHLLGWPCLFGVAAVFIAQVINAILARILVRWERVRRQATDAKLQQITQYVESIRHLRWYGWHSTWLQEIMTARQKELKLRIITGLWDIAIRCNNSLVGGLFPVVVFYAYTVIAGQELRVDVAFPALQLFTMLQRSLRAIPDLIKVLLNAMVAVGRIEDFMNEPDKAETNIVSQLSKDRLELRNASFAWPGHTQNVLHDLSVSFPTGFTLVFGPVGSGKTAFLQALLGELDLTAGELMRPNSAVGYCAQTPWLESMSIRDNILFTSPYDPTRYKQTLEACALTPDLASFQHGDLSNIGENGIGLSGGQKARIALARAIYSSSKILLLDDPLSALDQQTAQWVVDKCLTGPLVKGRTTILVTHRTDLCKQRADQLVEIINGTAKIFRDEIEALPELTLMKTTSRGLQESQDEAKALESAAVPDKFEEEEKRVHGGVQFAVYWEYIKAGRLQWWAGIFISAALFQLLATGESWFLKEWGEAYKRGEEQLLILFHTLNDRIYVMDTPISGLFDRFPNPAHNVHPWLLGYLIIVLASTVAIFVARCLVITVTYFAGKKLFEEIIMRISNTPFRYYDVTPVGRLMNRLTSDVGTIDGDISTVLIVCTWFLVAWLASILVIGSVTPLFLVFALALTLSFILIFRRFISTSQSLRRLEMVSLSPLMSNFGALLQGLMTVRAFCAQPQFQSRIITTTDAFQKMDHFYWSLQAWLMYRFDALSAVSTFLLTMLAIFSNLTPGLTAFVLIAAANFVESTHWLCKSYGQLQLDFVSVERVVELLHLDQEEPGDLLPPAIWPRHGAAIEIEDLTISYSPTQPPALRNINLSIPGGTTTAITGRTGSGKSTLALSLLSTTPAPITGRILIDGLDINKVNKQTLRERITFLAQDPVLFPGTLRHNLDPLSQHTDAACASVLARVCASQPLTLTTVIEAGGRNLSQGQRQLIGLARAILRRSSVVILDEATASIDLATAEEVQRILHEEMVGATVVVIAHRRSAVVGCQGEVRLKNGTVESLEGDVSGVVGDGTGEEADNTTE